MPMAQAGASFWAIGLMPAVVREPGQRHYRTRIAIGLNGMRGSTVPHAVSHLSTRACKHMCLTAALTRGSHLRARLGSRDRQALSGPLGGFRGPLRALLH